MSVADRLYPTDNSFGIPCLRNDMRPQAGLLLPCDGWGALSRRRRGVELWHFYTSDYRFENVWNNPDVIIRTGCTEIIEPNFSIYDTTPRAQALWQIYRKRWLGRYFQDRGVRVWADLNVSPAHSRDNILGIPQGYDAFATRATDDRAADLLFEIETARHLSGKSVPNMLVFGGGPRVAEICLQAGVIHVKQCRTERRKRP